MHILLVEDDELIATGLQLALERAHHIVDWVSDGIQGQARARSKNYDLVILDLGLPGRDGFDVLRSMRDSGSLVSVLILSARDATPDRIRGLDLGADDYLTKPFELDELLARIRALERRRSSHATNTLVRGQLSLDIDKMSLSWNGAVIDLPRREWVLLKLLMEYPERVFSREQIENALYGWTDGAESNAVDVHVHHLRKKIIPEIIQTVRGMGYRFGSAD
ncbi:MAG: response regulator transcription factor [Burkholderiales bacterium]|jgi:two-component system response regulator QseB